MPAGMARWINFPVDGWFLVFCVAVTGAAALLFGLAPILQASRTDIRGSLQNAAARTTATRGRRNALDAMVVCEIGLALMVSMSASLLVRAFHKVLATDRGFRAENVLTFGISLPDADYGKPEQKIAYYEKLLARLRELPGVRAAGATSAPPLGGHWGGQFEAEGGNARDRRENPVVLRIAPTTGYFHAICMTLLSGRMFGQQPSPPNSPRVVAVNRTFPENSLGRRKPHLHPRPPPLCPSFYTSTHLYPRP